MGKKMESRITRTVMGRVVEYHSPAKHPEQDDAMSSLPPGIMLAATDEELYREAMKQFKEGKGEAAQPAPSPKPTAPAGNNSTLDKDLKDAEAGKQTKPKGYFRRGY